ATVQAYDPAGMEQAKRQLPSVIYCNSAYSAADSAEAVVIATEWEQFRALDLAWLKSVMARPIIIDLRNIYRTDEMNRANFRYVAVGPLREIYTHGNWPHHSKEGNEVVADLIAHKIGGKI